jgi:hypothetical protein
MSSKIINSICKDLISTSIKISNVEQQLYLEKSILTVNNIIPFNQSQTQMTLNSDTLSLRYNHPLPYNVILNKLRFNFTNKANINKITIYVMDNTSKQIVFIEIPQSQITTVGQIEEIVLNNYELLQGYRLDIIFHLNNRTITQLEETYQVPFVFYEDEDTLLEDTMFSIDLNISLNAIKYFDYILSNRL